MLDRSRQPKLPKQPPQKTRQTFAERTGVEHGRVKAVKEVPAYYNYTPFSLGLITNPIIYGVRRLRKMRQPYRCPKCGKPTSK